MNKLLYIFLILIIAGIILVLFLHNNPKPVTPKNLTIVAFGDSLVEGYGANKGNDFVSILGNKLGINIINKGRSGDTTESALNRINEVLDYNPGIVIILLGGNDYLRKVPKETTFENLGKIVGLLKENDSRVILLGVRGGLLKDNYEESFKNFAKSNDLVYVENVLDGLLNNQEVMSDQIHPNDKGYKIIADKVLPALKLFLK